MPAVEDTWHDRATGNGIIRVVYQPGEDTRLIALAGRGVCLYQATFHAGTPDAVVIAATEEALRLAPPEAGGGRPRPAAGRRRAPNGKG